MKRSIRLTMAVLMLAAAAAATSACTDTQATAATGKENSSMNYLDQVTAQKNHTLDQILKREFSTTENE